MQTYSQDLSNGLENVPVLIESSVPKEAFTNFQYVPENVQGPGCDLDPSAVTLPGCSCHSQSCLLDRCPCLRFGQTYNNDGLLNQQQEEGGYSRPVFECNALCACSESCQNRVVQNGIKVRLGVFSTKDRGLGVETLERLPCGRFVCEYTGEIIGPDEARSRQLSQTPDDMNYIIAVQEHSGGDRVTQMFVDPVCMGNVGRFMNHSCQPNLVMVPVRVHSLLPRLALFTNRKIEQGEELTFDYAGGLLSSTDTQKWDKVPSETQKGPDGGKLLQRKACYCGASNCSGFLPLDISVLN
ncbi:histone-lysine N-methyltransferase SETMAR-like isoform X1 [Myxocyprinus asiaticus]|uniref:histone-lysine N-methyltransferase SETMAR-like isoform X1 n=1 Tax=Myxocyprinus asiaticus TaxID=70543 RepID=UPI00222188FC|nr:histone-lysine N-methyltransferase SETMAR-like isoform X1 [Myxocyprinus asiaticus]